MWKYILAATLLIIGTLELVLAFHKGLREAVMQASPVRSNLGESSVLIFAGISAIVTAIGIIFYGLFF